MTKSRIGKPTSNGATVTPTVDAASVARCGIPAPSKNGRNNVKLKLADDVVARLAALDKPLPAQAQAILYELDQLGGSKVGVSQSDLIDRLDSEASTLSTTQGATRILTFYRKRLIEEGLGTTGA